MAEDEPCESNEPYLLGLETAHPDIPKRLGILLAEFGAIEFFIFRLLGTVLGETSTEAPRAVEMLGPVQSISLRLEIIEGARKASNLPEPQSSQISAALASLRTINSLRNEYVHACYGVIERTGQAVRETWFSSTRRESKLQPIDATRIQSDIETVRAARNAIISSLYRRELVPRTSP